MDRPLAQTTDTADGVKSRVRGEALNVGFDAVGFTAAAAGADDGANLNRFLAEGRHGDMTWMAGTADRRADPTVLWPEARSIVAVGVNYGPAGDPLAALTDADRGAISVYARGRDYHDILKKRLKRLGRWMAETFDCQVKVFVDTAPVMEKPVAMRAGLGWIGKHTNLVSRHYGSWLFLGEVFSTLDLPPDRPETDHCGTCDRCVRACPTGALDEPYHMDTDRCIAYQTVEHKGMAPKALRAAFKNRVYGCDDCLAVCPWNRFSAPTLHVDLTPRDALNGPRLADLAALDDAGFRALFAGTPVKRLGRDRFLRNVAVAIGNGPGGDAERAAVTHLAESRSPLVREAARWAIQRLEAKA